MSDRPNILWISFEDTSPRFGCYGDPVARTPNVDRLAAEGCVFPKAFSTAPVCAPSRSAIITGCYQTWLGTQHMRTTHQDDALPELPTPYSAVVPPVVKCFTEYLRAAGYFCTNNHKTDYQFSPPLTAWDELGDHAHWRHRAAGQPFFAVFNPTTSHESGQWPKDDEELVTDPDAVTLPPYLPDTPEGRKCLARQYDNIERNDRLVGELLQQLEEDGELDDTIVFIWSDHGEGLPRGKRWPYDSGINVPLVVRWPGGLEHGTSDERLVSMIDLGPTVLSLCGVEVPRHMQGQPFLGPEAVERDYVYATRDRYDTAYDQVRVVRSRRYKYLRNCMPEQSRMIWVPYRNRHPIVQELYRRWIADELRPEEAWFAEERRPVEELYDLDADPHEMTNVAADPAHHEALIELRAACDDYLARYDRYHAVSEEEMVAAWYPGGEQPTTGGPVFVPISEDDFGRNGRLGGELVVNEPALLQLTCATHGASLAWTDDPGEDPRWRPHPDHPGQGGAHRLRRQRGAGALGVGGDRGGLTAASVPCRGGRPALAWGRLRHGCHRIDGSRTLCAGVGAGGGMRWRRGGDRT